MSYTDRFGGSTITAAQVAYRAVSLTESLYTAWPVYATQSNVIARIMNVVTLNPGAAVVMPDARETAPGQDVLFYNNGALSYSVVAKDGTIISTVASGERQYIVLTDNSTEGGSWVVTNFGVGTGNLDVAAAAGPGLLALGVTLGLARIVVAVSSSRDVMEGDRARVLSWTGGVGALTLPLTSTYPRFEFSVCNQGSGALTITPSGGETVDGNGSIVLNIGESADFFAGTGEWVTVGRGRSTQFSFTQLQKVLTGGTTVLSLTEAANVVQTYTGALSSNAIVELPGVVQIYYVSNRTTGAYSLTLKNPGGSGSTVVIPQGENVIIFSDGVNLVNASTTTAVVSGSIVFDAGSAAFATAGFASTDTGLFSPGPGELGVTVGGTQIANFDSTGMKLVGSTPSLFVESSSAAARARLAAPAGTSKSLELYTGANARWSVTSDSTNETGSNAGSNLAISRYSDAGALLGDALTINRASGQVAIPVLTLGMDPATFDQAATKNYVDGVTPLAVGLTFTPGVSTLGSMPFSTSASQTEVTLPSDASAAIRIGGIIPFLQRGTGAIHFNAGSGATVNTASGLFTSQGEIAAAQKVAANTWQLYGTRL